MDFTIELDPEALWQDTMDLLAEESLPGAMLAMLESCTPTSVEGDVLHLETNMRLVLRTISKNSEVLEKCLSTAAFQPMKLDVSFAEKDKTAGAEAKPAVTSSMTREEAASWEGATQSAAPQQHLKLVPAPEPANPEVVLQRRRDANPLVEGVPEADSKLTFDRFVCGDENSFAYQAALQVANGSKKYNPLFIYGKSGLGKTHLLRAIQNYIAENDSSRICVYKDSSSFITDYTSAMGQHDLSVTEALRRNYADIDVLIIDDVQKLAGKAGTINFFFDTFNVLQSNGKQIVLAADRTPAQLGMGKDGFDERVTSRIGQGYPVPVQVPSYEMKLRLIETFCHRIREDSEREHVGMAVGVIGEDGQQHMAERAGSNIRLIEGFCQRCLMAQARAAADGSDLTNEEIDEIAKETWPTSGASVSIEEVQRAVEKFYDVSHADLVGKKRNKNIMEPRHVAVWLSRELCDKTLASIGEHFGGRTHATVKASLKIVDEARKEDKVFYDRLMRLKESITNDS